MPVEQIEPRCAFIELQEPLVGIWRFVGSVFFISQSGRFLTAKHNINFHDLDGGRYTLVYGSRRFPVRRAVNQKLTVEGDVGEFEVLNLSHFRFPFFETGLNHQLRPGQVCYVGGFLASDKQFHVVTSGVTRVEGRMITLHHGNLGAGMSGAPVVAAGRAFAILSQIDSLNPIISRATAIPTSERPRLVSDNSTLDPVSNFHKHIIGRMGSLKKLYNKVGDPILIIDQAMDTVRLIETQGLEDNIAAAQLMRFLGYLYINHHSGADSTAHARIWLSRAHKILGGLNYYSTEVSSEIARTSWLEAISYKQEARMRDATRICETALVSVEDLSDDEKLVLRREIAIVNRSTDLFADILRQLPSIQCSPIERSHSLRRILEHFLFSRQMSRARRMYGNAITAFDQVGNFVDPIYHVQMGRVSYMYYALTGERDKARRLFNSLISQATAMGLQGQLKTLKTMRDSGFSYGGETNFS